MALSSFLAKMGDGHGPYLAAKYVQKSAKWRSLDSGWAGGDACA